MKKILLVSVALVVVVGLAGLGYVAYLARSLNTPEFKQQVLAEAKTRFGTEVSVEEMDIALLSGVTLRAVEVKNPNPFEGNLLTADAFVLRYRLAPLLSGRVEVEELSLAKPALGLAMDEKGKLNYERLMAEETSPSPPPASPAESTSAAVPLELLLKDLSVSDASITMADADETMLARVEDADFRSAFRVAGGVAQGEGRATIATISLADLLFVRDVSAPLEVSKQAVKLSPIEAKVAGGKATGDVNVQLEGGFGYGVTLKLDGVEVETLLREAKSTAGVSGTLQASTTFGGSGGLPTIRAQGQGQIADCKVEDAKVLALLSKALKVPELANPEFEECRAEFTLRGSRLETPTLSLKGDAIQLSGKGTVNLDTSRLDYDMNLALAQKLLEKIKVNEIRSAFADRGDGFSSVDFRIYGTTADPQTDLVSKIGKAAATKAIKGKVDKLLGGKKLF